MSPNTQEFLRKKFQSKISSLKFCAEKFTLKLKTSKSERQATKGGRTSDFINLMLKTHIDEKDKKSATKGMTQDEMIGQVAILYYSVRADYQNCIQFFRKFSFKILF